MGESLPAAVRVSWVDHVKAIAIILVIAYHATGVLGVTNYTGGQTGVDLFLIVSGYTLATNLKAESPWSFYWRRLLRLLPAYWIAIVVAWIALKLIGNPPTRTDLLLHASLLHLYFERYFFGMLNPWWFMGAIGFLYMLFPLLARFIRQGRINTIMLIGVILTLAWSVEVMLFGAPPFDRNTVWIHFVVRIPMFFVGIGIVMLQQGADLKRDALPLGLLLATLLAIAIAMERTQPLIWYQAVGLFYCWIAFLLSQAIQRARIVAAASAWLAAISYELFLIHDVFLTKLHGVTAQLLQPYLGVSSRVGAAILGIAISVLVAIAMRWAASRLVAVVDRKRGAWLELATRLYTTRRKVNLFGSNVSSRNRDKSSQTALMSRPVIPSLSGDTR